MKKETAELLVDLIRRLDTDTDGGVRKLLAAYVRCEGMIAARKYLVAFLIGQDQA